MKSCSGRTELGRITGCRPSYGEERSLAESLVSGQSGPKVVISGYFGRYFSILGYSGNAGFYGVFGQKRLKVTEKRVKIEQVRDISGRFRQF